MIMSKGIMYKLAVLAGAVVSLQIQAEAVDDLALLLAQRDCLAATFEQTLVDEQGTLLQTSSGTVQAARPNKLRWEISAPDSQLIVSDGQTLWRYEADLQQLIVSSFDDQGAGVPAKLLSGDANALAQYDVVEIKGGYQLTARQQDNLFGVMRFSFDGSRLTQLQIIDNFAQQTSIQLSPVDLDCSDDQLYLFEAPANTDVLYE